MSTRQRLTLETTVEPVSGGPRLLARAVEGGATPAGEDLAARRLRELAMRLSSADLPQSDTDKDNAFGETDAEFEPVTLATITTLGRQQKPDAPGDSLTDAGDATSTAKPLIAVVNAPDLSAPAATGDDTQQAAPALLAIAPPPEPFRLADDDLGPLDVVAIVESEAEVTFPSLVEDDASPAPPASEDQPLMLSDQSTTDIRLVDLIRRQQSILDQLNRFPPPTFDTSERAVTPVTSEPEPEPPQRPVVDQRTPPPDVGREIPPPLPPPERMALPPPAARERKDEPVEQELPEQSPIIIQRARAERSARGRGGPAIAAPPSAVPAFFVGLAVAIAIAGVLFVVI